MTHLIDIEPNFLFVMDKGFLPDKHIYQSQNFGNASLVMVGLPFSLRFERDRSQVFVDVGNDKLGWFKLEYVLEFVDKSISQKQLGEPPSPAIMATMLQECWDRVADLFSNQTRILEFLDFSKEKSDAFLNSLIGSP